MIASELRLGNYITVHGHLQEVCELPLPENCTYENTKPIPLTEEWLLKFGFKYDNDSFKTRHEGQLIEYCKNTVYLEGSYGAALNSQCFIIENVKYVHQLQNLYFVLTGEELTLNK